MLVASELIIALGVLCLIIGIFIAIAFAITDTQQPAQLSLEGLRPFLMPFAEGLFAAGLAPVLAATLRQIEVLKYADDADGAPKDDLGHMRDKIHDLTEVINSFISACERSQTTFEKGAMVFNRSTDLYESAAKRVEAALGGLADSAVAQGRRFDSSFTTLSDGLSGFDKALAQSTHEVDGLREATRRHTAATEEGTLLLEGLRKLIASVQRFIHPDA
jgi:hypothetical protein